MTLLIWFICKKSSKPTPHRTGGPVERALAGTDRGRVRVRFWRFAHWDWRSSLVCAAVRTETGCDRSVRGSQPGQDNPAPWPRIINAWDTTNSCAMGPVNPTPWIRIGASVAAARALRAPCRGAPQAGDQGVRSGVRRSGAAARLMLDGASSADARSFACADSQAVQARGGAPCELGREDRGRKPRMGPHSNAVFRHDSPLSAAPPTT